MSTIRVIIGLLIALAAMETGCKPGAKERKYRSVVVTTTQINVESGIVVVDWQDSTTAEIKERTGRVTYETEIFINGISANLEDIKIGDQAVVTVYSSPENPSEWIVTSVSIERKESFILNKPLPDTSPSTDQLESNK